MATDPTEAQARNVELAQRGLGNWMAGHREAAIATFSEDIEIHVPAELGNAGTFHGIDGFHEWNDAWEEAWSEMTITAEAIEPVGDSHVVALIHSRGKGSASGIEVDNHLGWVLCVDDGKLTYLGLQPDLEAARRHALEREAD